MRAPSRMPNLAWCGANIFSHLSSSLRFRKSQPIRKRRRDHPNAACALFFEQWLLEFQQFRASADSGRGDEGQELECIAWVTIKLHARLGQPLGKRSQGRVLIDLINGDRRLEDFE